jgi:membrane protease YdiL (CAAX protease family)
MSNASSKPAKPPAEPVKAARPPLPRVPWNPWLGVILIISLYYTAQLMAGLLVSVWPLVRHWSQLEITNWLQDSVYAQFSFIVLAEGLMLGVLYLFLKRYHASFKTIGLLRPRWRDLLYGLAAVPLYYLIYLIVVAVTSHFVPGLNIDQEQQIGFDNAHGAVALTLTFISLVVLPPLAEEIMVRGFLYSSLKKAMKIVPAALAASLIFAVAHLPEGGPAGPLYIAAIDTFVLSLVLIYLREKTGSLWSSITLHAIKNGVAFVALFILQLH